MRAAGIDFGKVRVGIAVSDELGMLAHPRPFLNGKNMRILLSDLKRLRDEEELELFVVGLPRMLDGTEGPAARRVRRFAELLRKVVGVRVELVDERLSTRQAHARLQEGGVNARRAREKVDSASAAILLQSWLDGRSASS